MIYKINLFGFKFDTHWYGWMRIISFIAFILKVIFIIGAIVAIGFVMDFTSLNWFLTLALIYFCYLVLVGIFSNK